MLISMKNTIKACITQAYFNEDPTQGIIFQ